MLLMRDHAALGFKLKCCAKLHLLALALYFSVVQCAVAEPFKLEDLLFEAVKTHPNIIAKKNEYEAAGYNLEGAQWNRFPTLSTDVRALDTGTKNATVRVEQPLWTGGRITSQIGVATAGVDIANAALHEIEQSILQQTLTAFFDVQRLKIKLKFARTNESEHQRLAESMARRVKSEISAVADQNQTSIRLRQATAERIQIERQLINARINLEQLVGKTVPDIAQADEVNLDKWTEDAMLEAAKSFSPERKRLLAQIQSADFEIGLAKSRVMPQLVAGYQVQLGSLNGLERDQAYLALQLQPGAGLSSLSAIQAAVAKKQAADEALSAFDRQLKQNFLTAWADYNALVNQLQPARDSAASSDMVVASYVRQFQVGKKNWLEVLNSQREKTQALFALADIESPLQLAAYKLLLISGQISANKVTLSNDERK